MFISHFFIHPTSNFVKTDPTHLPIAQSHQLAALLDGHYNHLLDEFHVIDCRFPYEFEGGHIAGARNINTKGELDDMFFKKLPSTGGDKIANAAGKRVVVVFHCEFSSHRAPTM